MKKTTIAFQGMSGAYSEQAILEYGKKIKVNFDPVPCETFSDLFNSIENKTKLGLVPFENSTTGSVVPSHDLLLEYTNLEVIGEYILPIHHCLLGLPGSKLSGIKDVFSHPQAVAQCEKFLDDHGLKRTSHTDTAGSAEELSREGKKAKSRNAGSPEHAKRVLGKAAIASALAGEKYGLKILKKNIEDNKNNKTRFILVKNKNASFDFEKKLPKPNKTSVIFETRNIPSALYKALGGFATNGINMVKLESRPKKGEFNYLFYLDIEGVPGEEGTDHALEELTYFSENMRILGSYKKA